MKMNMANILFYLSLFSLFCSLCNVCHIYRYLFTFTFSFTLVDRLEMLNARALRAQRNVEGVAR